MDDHELRARFHELRDVDRMRAPGFHSLLGRAAEPTRAGARRRGAAVVWLAAAASVLFALGITLRSAFENDVIILVAAAPEAPPERITEWTSPTDGLLATTTLDALSATSGATWALDTTMPALPLPGGDVP